jgi:hypothetical protein
MLGFPFINTIQTGGAIGYFSGLSAVTVMGLLVHMPGNVNYIQFPYKGANSSGVDGFLTYGNLINGTTFVGAITYVVA